MDLETNDSLRTSIKANPQAALEKRTCLKILFIRKMLLVAFIQLFFLLIIYLIFMLLKVSINYNIVIPGIFLGVIAVFSLISFFGFKSVRQTPYNIMILFIFTLSELVVILYGLSKEGTKYEASYIIVLTLCSITSIYLIFLIYSLFIKKRFKSWIPIVIIIVILALLFSMMFLFYPDYTLSISLDCFGVIIFTVYLTYRVSYINKKFGNGYSGQAYILLGVKMITDAFAFIVLFAAIAVVMIALGACQGGGGNTNLDIQGHFCNGFDACDCSNMNCDCNCDDCVCCTDNIDLVGCCCICFVAHEVAEEKRLDYNDLEKFDQVPQSDFEVAPLPMQTNEIGLVCEVPN